MSIHLARRDQPRKHESTKRQTVLISCFRVVVAMTLVIGFAAARTIGQTPALDPTAMNKPPIDTWPTYHGDYSGRRYSTLKQITRENVKNLSLAWVYRLNTSRGNAMIGGEGPEDAPPGTPTIKSTPLLVNGVAVFLLAGSRVGDRRAQRPRDLALLLEDARRQPHRQSRRRDLRQLALFPHPRQLLRVARRGDGEGALASRDRQHESRVLLDQRADRDRQTRDHRRRRRRARRAGVSRVARPGERSADLALAHGAEAGRSRREHVAERVRDGATAAACRGCPAPTIRISISITSAPAIRIPCSRARAARATTCTRARSSRSIPTRARWCGTTR